MAGRGAGGHIAIHDNPRPQEERMRIVSGMAAAAAAAIGLSAGAAQAMDAKVIELTQVGCQFIESENGVDHHFKTAKKADCLAINEKTGKDRLAGAKKLTIKPGKYVFRVANKNVPYELGFWLRDADYDWRNPLHKLNKTSVSRGGLTEGKSKDYEVTLKPGTYKYSCPLNATPDYTLVVEK
jgi:hypothetical protein